MDISESFSVISKTLCGLLIDKKHNKGKVNSLIDELNAKTYKAELFARKEDVISLVTALCSNIKPIDEFLAAKSSHLINNLVTKQNVPFARDYICKTVHWHIDCLKNCSEIIVPDILHNLLSIMQCDAAAGLQFTNDLLGNQGILLNIINVDRSNNLRLQSPLQTCLTAMKCIACMTTTLEDSKMEPSNITLEIKEHISNVIIRFLMNGHTKTQDEFVYCKVVIYALRVLSHLYFNDEQIHFEMPEVMGICRFFILYGLIDQRGKLEKIMPSQQTIAPASVRVNPKGGKKQKVRKQRNNAVESLKKEIPVSDRSLMRDVGDFENNSAYKPASQNYLGPQKTTNCWQLTSDSDMSDLENGREAKLIALKSRVRQSASNLFLVLFKIKEKKEIFGYWWALLPDSPNDSNWFAEEATKRTLAYCALTDPVVGSRKSALNVILAILAGSKMYLSQAEASNKVTTSFIPFSVTLGYTVTCAHKLLTAILDIERSHGVLLVAMKCCAALVQATPYHKMQDGLISELVRSTRKFLVHRDVQLQVSALITLGCVLSVDPKVDEILKAVEKDPIPCKSINVSIERDKTSESDECDDFEEGYSDDEMFTAVESASDTKSVLNEDLTSNSSCYFKSWILDICFKNMGWVFKHEVLRCKPSATPVILESLQVLSAIAFHNLSYFLHSHVTLLADILAEMLRHELQDVVSQTARTISVIGDAIQKLEQTERAPPLGQCVRMWEKLLSPLAAVLQSHEGLPAKAFVCDCIANIGERSFKELPRRQQMFCCALLMGCCSDEAAAVRAASVRALAMILMYRTLREDICFVSDCGENILRVLAEPGLIGRTKAAWALGNLSGALVFNMDEPDIDGIDDDLLRRLLEASVQCANDNDKIKMSATRGLGNFLRLITNGHLARNTELKTLSEVAIEKLLDCACKVSNMKVRWNACYALGNAMKNEHLFTCFNGWQGRVLGSLGTLARDCKNLKVRINAATALRACASRAHYGPHYAPAWRDALAALDSAHNVHDVDEYKHKDNLIEQLCVTLAHLCCLLKQSDLSGIMDALVFHFDCAKSLLTQLYHKLPPENPSCLQILQAARYVTTELTASNDTQMQSLGMLQEIFICDI